jgi:hypothetical protein
MGLRLPRRPGNHGLFGPTSRLAAGAEAGNLRQRSGSQSVPELRLAGPLARLHHTAMRLGITVLHGAAGDSPWPDESNAAIVAFGEHIALKPGLEDGLRADVLAMALIVAAVMGDRPAGHSCAITAPGGFVLISQTRAARDESGPGKLATLLARKCGRDTASAAFEYTTPATTDSSPWAPWIQAAGHRATAWHGHAVPPVADEVSSRGPGEPHRSGTPRRHSDSGDGQSRAAVSSSLS